MSLFIRDLSLGNPLDLEDSYYDEFIGKWIKKRKGKRASNPKVIARRERKKRRMPRGRNIKSVLISKRKPVQNAKKTVLQDRPIVRKPFPKSDRTTIKKGVNPIPKAATPIKQTTMIPLTREEAQVHKNVNKAIQEEHKTKQEELKTKNLETQVAQEAAKTEQIKGQTQMASTSKGLLWVVGVLGIVLVAKFVLVNTAPNDPSTT